MISGKIYVDVTSLTRWTGPPVGIARVERALAEAALARADAQPVVFDDALGAFRMLAPAWESALLGWSARIDVYGSERRLRHWLSRQGAVAALERLRLRGAGGGVAGIADRLQRAILGMRPHDYPLFDQHGDRVANVPPDMALGAAVDLQPADVLFFAGFAWSHVKDQRFAHLKAARGFRVATLCFDLIPLTHSQFYATADVERFRRYWLDMLPIADLTLVTARCIARDLEDFCRSAGLPPATVRSVPLGFDPPPVADKAQVLPAGLEPGRFVLFVSTIEPRKGHRLLLQVWRRLVDRGIPPRHGFKLVLLGRAGWMVDDVLRDLAAAPEAVVHLRNATDAELSALYEAAAFCCYPSLYEGFGLPMIEAFARGKAVIATTGGAVPETVGDLSPCLDPTDPDIWEEVLGTWIEHPEARRPYEERIATGFRHPAWQAAADHILDVVAELRPGAEAQGPQP